MTTQELLTIQLERRLLYHPQGFHIRRMGSSLWLYLFLLERLTDDEQTVSIAPSAVAKAMGLREGTVRSWLGHLTKGRYVKTEGRGETVRVSLRRDEPRVMPATRVDRAFTVEGITHSLGEGAERKAIQTALDEHTDSEIRRALAGALAVPTERIRKSRTALFLYLLTHPRP